MIPALVLRYLPHAVVAVATLGAIWWAHDTVWDKGYASCESKHAVAAAEAAAEDHKNYLAAVAWGNEISAQLAARQAENATLKESLNDYAARLSGNCPAGLRLLHDAAAFGQPLPQSAGPLVDAAATTPARPLAEAVNRNYATCRDCADRLNALIDWHESLSKKKEEK